MEELGSDQIRKIVRENYARVVTNSGSSCGCGCSSPQDLTMIESPCCGGPAETAEERPSQDSRRLGYSENEIGSVPEGANLGLGCGNPQAIAELKSGEVVVDLGSGGGFDCFLAANQVGLEGHVIGVDMTPEMISKARENAVKGGYANIEFRLGEIEHLPVADASADVILSNCVVNLSPDKPSVYQEAFRVLKPGGRLAISDTVSKADLPEALKNDLNCYCGCITGAARIAELQQILEEAGFVDIRIQPKDESKEFVSEWVPGKNIEEYVVSATIEAVKP